MTPQPSLEEIRSCFPAFTQNGAETLLDNAGGSQVPQSVIDAVVQYMQADYVQLGADYPRSQRATAKVADAHRFADTVVNAGSSGQTILGMSTSSLCATLADAYRRARPDGGVIVVAEGGHEAGQGPWYRLADAGWEVRTWEAREDGSASLEDLEGLLDEHVDLVAMHHVSNLLGAVEDVAGAARLAHRHGARLVVDGVAFAPHRAIDVQALGVDWYVFSTYKVYGPHMAVMYGSHEALAELEGPNHGFIAKDDVPYKWELGGVPHESCAAWLGVEPYLAWLAGEEASGAVPRSIVERAFDRMASLELELQRPLVDWLREHPKVRLIGPASSGEERVPTVSFVHSEKSSRAIAQAANAAGWCIRFGHFYAPRLCTRLGLEPDDGVVRVSAVHYNTPAEIEGLLGYFAQAL